MGSPIKKWAVLVYMAADVPSGIMRSAARRNLHQLARAGSSEDVYVAAQVDLRDEPTRRYVFPVGGIGESSTVLAPAENLKNVDSASAASVYAFLKWTRRECPAERYVVIFWGHG